ncbi:MAG: TolC family protein, partial [Bacteroidaceae bacterium]|nr:TolC family protein [Bacteroidaceae bacterium]
AKAANGVDESRLEVSLAEKTRQQAEESMKLSGKQYEAGVEPLSDYLEAQALWQKACEAEVGAHFQLYLSSVEYLRAAGR